MRRVTLYTRTGCHLCERVHGALLEARRVVAFDLDVFDIDSDEALRARYNYEVPVVAIDGRELFGHAMDINAFLRRLEHPE